LLLNGMFILLKGFAVGVEFRISYMFK
jgi:hypothetical protein